MPFQVVFIHAGSLSIKQEEARGFPTDTLTSLAFLHNFLSGAFVIAIASKRFWLLL